MENLLKLLFDYDISTLRDAFSDKLWKERWK